MSEYSYGDEELFISNPTSSNQSRHAATTRRKKGDHIGGLLAFIVAFMFLTGAAVGALGYEKIFESKHIDDAIDEIRGNIYTVVGETQYYNDGIVKIGGLEISGAEELRGKVGSGVNVIVFYIDSDRTDAEPGVLFDWRLSDEAE